MSTARWSSHSQLPPQQRHGRELVPRNGLVHLGLALFLSLGCFGCGHQTRCSRRKLSGEVSEELWHALRLFEERVELTDGRRALTSDQPLHPLHKHLLIPVKSDGVQALLLLPSEDVEVLLHVVKRGISEGIDVQLQSASIHLFLHIPGLQRQNDSRRSGEAVLGLALAASIAAALGSLAALHDPGRRVGGPPLFDFGLRPRDGRILRVGQHM
mmetsp:Transcript_27549/g.56798  ORF Transcript_27549/g.56798 Transcript_27549/m.56798 type:complete len:213 (-) Transcript_27549:8-646(-)